MNTTRITRAALLPGLLTTLALLAIGCVSKTPAPEQEARPDAAAESPPPAPAKKAAPPALIDPPAEAASQQESPPPEPPAPLPGEARWKADRIQDIESGLRPLKSIPTKTDDTDAN